MYMLRWKRKTKTVIAEHQGWNKWKIILKGEKCKEDQGQGTWGEGGVGNGSFWKGQHGGGSGGFKCQSHSVLVDQHFGSQAEPLSQLQVCGGCRRLYLGMWGMCRLLSQLVPAKSCSQRDVCHVSQNPWLGWRVLLFWSSGSSRFKYNLVIKGHFRMVVVTEVIWNFQFSYPSYNVSLLIRTQIVK